MKKSVLFFLILSTFFLSLCSCQQHYAFEGLDHFIKYGYADSEMSIGNHLIVSSDFLKKYPYLKGDYHYDFDEKGWGRKIDVIERAFVWLTFDQITYEQVKKTCEELRDNENADLDGKKAFEFTFYTIHEWDDVHEYSKFPYYFTAYGYNNDNNTFVFIGFYTYKDDSREKLHAGTDLEGFIQTYFGEWYNWEQ